MKNILIITYYWPPFSGSGVQRWLKFTKYLPEFGFKPHVYTPENPHFDIKDEKLMEDIHDEVVVIKRKIWEPYSLADLISGKKGSNKGVIADGKKSWKPRILNHIRANYFIPDPRKFWVGPSVKFLQNYISEHGIEYVVTTGPPHSMHLIGAELKKHKAELKWIVDIRDPWSRFDFLKDFGSTEKSLNKQAQLESSVLEKCDLVLSTSVQMKDLLVSFDHDKFHCITNGYDAEDFKDYTDNSNEDSIVIYHAGLLNKLRNPSFLWQALESLCTNDAELNRKLIIHLVGIIDEAVLNEIQSHPHLKNKLKVESYKSHKEVIQDYGKSDVLLLLVNNTDNAEANIPGKLFEYIAANKKIMLFAGKGTDAEILLCDRKETMICSYDESLENNSHLKSFLLHQVQMGQEEMQFKLQFERKNLTSKLVNLLNQL